jgi:ectoine hydroxylase-related dioxygenase (phytanoyl-CoA dioxygenase family)
MHASHGIAKARDSQYVWPNEMKDIARCVAHDEFNRETGAL